MPLKMIGTGRGLMGGAVAAEAYFEKVLGYGPVAYWPLWETAGFTAVCLVNALQNGTYSSDVSTWPVGVGIGDGNTAPGFDGANDYVDVKTATLEAVINAAGAEFTIALWAKVAGAGTWADATWRDAAEFYDTGTNRFELEKSSVANRLYDKWVGGAVTEDNQDAGIVSTDFIHLVMTRSEAADEVKYYRDAGLLATDTVIGNWGSAGGWGNMVLGASSTAPTRPWHGGIAHVVLFSSALAQPAITDLATV